MARAPSYVREMTYEKRTTRTVGLRSYAAFVPRRYQILLASASGKRTSWIAGGRDGL